AGGAAQPLCHGVRGRAEVAGRGSGAAPEMDRPVAVAQHLYGRSIGQEARRDLQARLAARAEDHLLPARLGRDACLDTDPQGGGAQARPGAGNGRSGRQAVRDQQPRLRGMPVITLGSLSFNGPFLTPLWNPPKSAGLYAVLVPGWRLLTFRALYFGQAEV